MIFYDILCIYDLPTCQSDIDYIYNDPIISAKLLTFGEACLSCHCLSCHTAMALALGLQVMQGEGDHVAWLPHRCLLPETLSARCCGTKNRSTPGESNIISGHSLFSDETDNSIQFVFYIFNIIQYYLSSHLFNSILFNIGRNLP
jgi:hypothetical protein